MSYRQQNTKVMRILEELTLNREVNLIPLLETVLNQIAIAEREQHLNAAPYERTETRMDYANGFKPKQYQTRSGPLHLQVPQVREGNFYPSCFEKGTRSERALALTIAEMYVKGVSTRRVKKITQELCGLDISSTQVSRISKVLDEKLTLFRERPLGSFKFIYVDAHYEKVRHSGSVRGLAVLKAIGINGEGKREILGISASLSEAEIHWRAFFEDLQRRGLSGVEMITSDDHAGLKAARRAVFPSIPWQRCTFHMAQNAQSYAPSRVMKEEIGQVIRDLFHSPSLASAMEAKQSAIKGYEKSAPEFCNWLEENIEEGLTFFNHPRSYWKKIRTVNMVERFNEEIRRRTKVARLFPNEESCLRLVTAIAQDQNEEWISGRTYMKIIE
jgi:transposase-like protein